MFRPETTRLDKQREELTTRIDKYEVAHNEDATIVSNQRFTVKEMKTLKERKDDLTYNIRKQERRITKSLQRAKEAHRDEPPGPACTLTFAFNPLSLSACKPAHARRIGVSYCLFKG